MSIAIMSSSSCSVSPVLPPPSGIILRDRISLNGELGQYEASYLDNALNALSSSVVLSIHSISLNTNPAHYPDKAIMHCHDNGDICISSVKYLSLVYAPILWHESWYAYYFYLERHGSDFAQEWLRSVGDIYERDVSSHYPHHGIFSQDPREDLAEWGAHIHCALNGRPSIFSIIKDSDGFIDPIYYERLHILWRYGFIDNDQYRHMLEFLR